MLSARETQPEGRAGIDGGSFALWTTRRPVCVDRDQFNHRLVFPGECAKSGYVWVG
jgi:hypothetical protein